MQPNQSTAVAVRQPSAMGFEPESFGQAMEMATTLAKSALLPEALRGKPADVLIILMQGRELGLSPMQSLSGIDVIKGKPRASAELLRAIVLSRPDVCEYLTCVEETDQRVTYETKRKGAPTKERSSYSMADATKAGLASNPNYAKYPKSMLGARASTFLIRRVYPDLARGVHLPEEMEDAAENATEVVAERMHAPTKADKKKPDLVEASVEIHEPEAEAEVASDGPSAEEQAEIRLSEEIGAASDLAALKAITTKIADSGLPKDAVERLRVDYGAKRTELQKAVA